MKIVLGSDHRGFIAKGRLKTLLDGLGHEVTDCGADSDKPCDYPDQALSPCRQVASRRADRAILLCGSGIGMTMVANKVPGIRAALCHDELTAEMSRRHNDANVLCLPADLLGDELIRRMVEVWLKAPFEGGRHKRRVDKIMRLEASLRKDPIAAPPSCSAPQPADPPPLPPRLAEAPPAAEAEPKTT